MEIRYCRGAAGFLVISFILLMFCWQEPVYAGSVNKENLITGVRNPSNGVIKYKVKVPAGEKIDYSVTLTPDKANGNTEVINGSWKNKMKKTVTKTITMNVNYLTNKYHITASYSKCVYGKEIIYKDVDSATSSLITSVVTKKLAWNFSELGKGHKNWKYRYKYVPYNKGFKQYVQIFDSNGKQIKSYVKQIVPITKITKIIKEMKAR